MLTRWDERRCSFIRTHVLQDPRLPPLCPNSRRSRILVSQPIQTTSEGSRETIRTFSPSIHAQPPAAPAQAYRSPSGALTPVWTLRNRCARPHTGAECRPGVDGLLFPPLRGGKVGVEQTEREEVEAFPNSWNLHVK